MYNVITEIEAASQRMADERSGDWNPLTDASGYDAATGHYTHYFQIELTGPSGGRISFPPVGYRSLSPWRSDAATDFAIDFASASTGLRILDNGAHLKPHEEF